jgi:hypothetical protein
VSVKANLLLLLLQHDEATTLLTHNSAQAGLDRQWNRSSKRLLTTAYKMIKCWFTGSNSNRQSNNWRARCPAATNF